MEHAGLTGPRVTQVVGPPLQRRGDGPQVLGPLHMAEAWPRSLVEGLARHGDGTAMSGSFASATLKKSCSLVESMTSMTASDEGFTHSPPMKNRSACRRGALMSLAMAMAFPT